MQPGAEKHDGRPGELARAQSRQSFVCLCQRKYFRLGFYRDTRRNFQKLFAITPG